MKHEAFYESGVYSAPEMHIYAGWVAHPGSFAARQVFFNEEKDIALIFSGECFAGDETYAALKAKGHRLDESGNDWLVHFYEEKGDQFFEKLNGPFTGLLIDKKQNRAFLFNDRYGTERIYWHESDEGTYFASEAKALLLILPKLRAFDDVGVAQYLALGCTIDERTLFRGIQMLAGASVWTFEKNRIYRGRYFSPHIWESQSILPADSFELEFQKTLKRVVARYFSSNSTLGISLTGGLDSRMIMASRPDGNGRMACYTFAGRTGETLDAQMAAQVASGCGLAHQVLRIDEDFLSNFKAHADRSVYVTDGYFGVLGAHEIYLSRKARHLAPLRLTGVFGGEILRGVSTFKPLQLSPELLSSDFRHNMDDVVLRRDKISPVSFAAFKEIPWHIFGSLAACRSQLTVRTPYLDNELVALAYRAPKSFRDSSLPALRFVTNNDPVLGEIPTDMGERLEASAIMRVSSCLFSKLTCKLDYYNSEGLPGSLSSFDPLLRVASSKLGILERHKYLTYTRWFRKELATYLTSALRDRDIDETPYWNTDFVKRMAERHISGTKNYTREINAVLTLGAVKRLLFKL
ncbi:MAG: hypothetical protein H0U76_07240 [Ktedonobacteraceae bacterium]|nr:hypothetical protein [Ktedonobacteraceae bacterium]